MGKIAEKQNVKRTNILDAAYELFTSKSFNSTSIDDVVRKAGIAKGTFYLYFKDKYDLMDRIIAHKSMIVLRSALDKLEEKKSNSEQEMSFTQQIIFILDCIVDYMQENKELLTLVDKKLSKCVSAFNTLADADLKDEISKLIQLNKGISKEETVKKIYLALDLIGSVGCDAIIYETPFRLEEIKPMMFSAAEKILA